MDTEVAYKCAGELADEMSTCAMGQWSFMALYVSMRDDLRCVYCECDVFSPYRPYSEAHQQGQCEFSAHAIFNYFSVFDHILPGSKYPKQDYPKLHWPEVPDGMMDGMEDPLAAFRPPKEELSNLVRCCVPCNQLKRKWDPNREAKIGEKTLPPIYIAEAGSGEPLGEVQRLELISRTQEYLQERRREANEKFAKQRNRIIDCMEQHGSMAENWDARMVHEREQNGATRLR
jgi:hypothetical protein